MVCIVKVKMGLRGILTMSPSRPDMNGRSARRGIIHQEAGCTPTNTAERTERSTGLESNETAIILEGASYQLHNLVSPWARITIVCFAAWCLSINKAVFMRLAQFQSWFCETLGR
jgi:hypothetical protein